MALIVTGATGHLGPHLIAELLRAGDFDRLYVAARRSVVSASTRVAEIERIARAQLDARGLIAARNREVIPVDTDHLWLGEAGALPQLKTVAVIVHAAADTRLSAPLGVLRASNVDTTVTICRLAAACPHLRQLLFVSTTCVAGCRRGRIPENTLDDSAGFANSYEQSKWEAEQVVAGSGLPVRIARLTTCAGSHATGYVHRFGALHQLLHWMSRGLVPMVPGAPSTPIDIISTDVAAAWLARAAAQDPRGAEVCHVALGDRAIEVGALLDVVIPLLDGGRRRIQRPMFVDEDVFMSFNGMVRLSGDALLARVQASAAAVLPPLLYPKVYDTTSAERCWGGELPHPDWRSLLERVVAFGRARRWGLLPEGEPCHA